MWDVELTDHKKWPAYHVSALMDGLSWLQSLQRVEGVENIFEDGHNDWFLAPRLCGRYFALLLTDSGEYLLTALHQKTLSNYTPEKESQPNRETAKIPLAWFAVTPWKAQWVESDGVFGLSSLHLNSGPFYFESQSIPAFSLVLPVASIVHKRMPHHDLSEMRTAVGNLRQIQILGNHIRR